MLTNIYFQELTHEDEERRKRRRERNKIAATKCRNKKKERTTRLIAEGEVLTIQNAGLKEELRKLKAEKRSLSVLMSQHESSCVKNAKSLTLNKAINENSSRRAATVTRAELVMMKCTDPVSGAAAAISTRTITSVTT